MIRHHRDYAFDKTQESRPSGEREGRMLCGADLLPLCTATSTLAFWWCPIDKITCTTCRAEREKMEQRGIWPTKEIADRDGRGAGSDSLDGWVYEA